MRECVHAEPAERGPSHERSEHGPDTRAQHMGVTRGWQKQLKRVRDFPLSNRAERRERDHNWSWRGIQAGPEGWMERSWARPKRSTSPRYPAMLWWLARQLLGLRDVRGAEESPKVTARAACCAKAWDAVSPVPSGGSVDAAKVAVVRGTAAGAAADGAATETVPRQILQARLA